MSFRKILARPEYAASILLVDPFSDRDFGINLQHRERTLTYPQIPVLAALAAAMRPPYIPHEAVNGSLGRVYTMGLGIGAITGHSP